MVYNSTYKLYMFNRSFVNAGYHEYNVTCNGNALGYETIELWDDINIGRSAGYFKEGYCTGEYINKGSEYKEGYLHRGDILRIYCETPENIKGAEDITLIIAPKNGLESRKYIRAPDVIANQYERMYP